MDYEELFGLDPEDTPETEEDAADDEAVDENGAEDAALEAADSESAENAEGGEAESEQTTEENAAYAAARRKAEAAAAAEVARVRAEAAKEKERAVAEAYRKMGLINPHTGKAITNEAEYEEYAARQAEQQKRDFLSQSGMSEEEYNAFVAGLPEVAEARRREAENTAAVQRMRQAEAEARISAEISEIAKLDSSIKSVGDLANQENYDTFYDLVKKGYSMVDAYKLANFDKLTSQTAAAERQKALTLAASKDHLRSTRARGEGAAAVPADVRAMYRMLNPDEAEAEIKAHYNKYLTK